MFTKTTFALATILVLSVGSLAQAASENDGGNETGGYVLPGSMDGVNPVYHPRWFPQYGGVMRSYDRANATTSSGASAAYGFVPPTTHHKHQSPR
jgi:hypothetical protein